MVRSVLLSEANDFLLRHEYVRIPFVPYSGKEVCMYKKDCSQVRAIACTLQDRSTLRAVSIFRSSFQSFKVKTNTQHRRRASTLRFLEASHFHVMLELTHLHPELATAFLAFRNMPIYYRLTSLSLKTPAGMIGLSQTHPVLNVGVGSLCGFLCPVLVRVGFVLFADAEMDGSVVVAASAANGEAATTAVRARATKAKRILVDGSFS